MVLFACMQEGTGEKCVPRKSFQGQRLLHGCTCYYYCMLRDRWTKCALFWLRAFWFIERSSQGLNNSTVVCSTSHQLTLLRRSSFQVGNYIFCLLKATSLVGLASTWSQHQIRIQNISVVWLLRRCRCKTICLCILAPPRRSQSSQ